ncbi:hypothetical protein A0H76_363 [Hepatospora eriocheir]|uniref:C2H2-type domain-containing protein n=1 Tax=Hepatospora eriocheir TaxID=1081669 RepID=A0A1X0QIX2_9MICR|nr:hypothetical protein A0H76_363 [Hepatospora eriocheir]
MEDFLKTFQKDNVIERKTIEYLLDDKGSLELVINKLLSNSSNTNNLEDIKLYLDKINYLRNNEVLKGHFISNDITQLENSKVESCKISSNKIKREDHKTSISSNNKVKRVKNVESIFYNNIYTPKVVVNKPNKLVTPTCLYLPLQCNICGLRYSEYDQLKVHIDDHRRRSQSTSVVILRRDYFIKQNVKTVKSNLQFPIIENSKFICNEDSPVCKVCNKRIIKFWDDINENWILKDSIKLNDGSYMHKKCVN